MTMTPESFRDLLDRETDAPPPFNGEGGELALGQRLLRRRRIAIAAGGALATAVIAVGAVVVIPALTGSDTDKIEPAPPALTDAEVVEACRNAEGDSSLDVPSMFDPGTPRVVSTASTDQLVIAALLSADGAWWADCEISLERPGRAATLTAWDAVNPSTTGIYRFVLFGGGFTCKDNTAGDATDCPTFTATAIDRLPDEVSAVQFDLADGSSPVIDTVDGFYVLNYRGRTADGAEGYANPSDPAASSILRVYYLNASGERIAGFDYAYRMSLDYDGNRELLDGLPDIRDFKSLRGDAASDIAPEN